MPVTIKECSGPPNSTVDISRSVPEAIFWSGAPTRARPTQIVFSVISVRKKIKRLIYWLYPIIKENTQNAYTLTLLS